MSEDPDVRHLFVYGTLRRGGAAPREIRRRLEEGADHLGPARTRGRLLVAGSGSYPALVRDGVGGPVTGDVYRLRDPGGVLEALDRYEGRRSDGSGLYRREAVPVRLVGSGPGEPPDGPDEDAGDGKRLLAWTYIYNRDTAGMEELEGGDWQRR